MTMASQETRTNVAEGVLRNVLDEIAVPKAVLAEARRRRDLVLEIAEAHPAGRARYASGSVAHGSANKPLEDADGGVKINRTYEAFRAFGPDGEGKGPEAFIQTFATFIEPRLRAAGYPRAAVNLEGNRAIKLEFNDTVEIDEWGPVDSYVDLIVGLARAEGSGLWIPNRAEDDWDPADPERHTWLMTERDAKPLRVHRVHLVRLAKRAIKRDELVPGRSKVLCSWNVSALALEAVEAPGDLATGLADLFAYASESIAAGLTNDPSPVVEEPIALPDGITREMAAARLREMADIVHAANRARSAPGAREELAALFGDEIKAIREREREGLNAALRRGAGAQVGGAVGVPSVLPPTRSGGARR